MAKSTAYIQYERNGKQVLLKGEAQLPEPAAHQSLVKVQYVAQNPTDGMHIRAFRDKTYRLMLPVVQSLDSNAFGEGSVLGCDFVGTVEEAGEDAKRLTKGDLVAGLVWGGEIKGLGAYGSYTLADDRISFKVPKGVRPEDAAAIPLATCTAWLALFSKNCLSVPRKNAKTSVLIWGGSSSVGSYAIQLASMYGINIITTCSPRNFDLVKKLGATHVFDYNDSAVVDKIKEVASDLEYTLDTIGSQESSTQASQAIRPEGGVLCTVRPGKANTERVVEGVRVTDVLVWTAFLKDHAYGEFKWPASVDDHELAAELFAKLPFWLEQGAIKPNNVKLFDTLDSIHEGFGMYRDGKISSFKIVYKV
ncbi:NAD(P)-binding protein [Aureobasidium subglaciale]|nr:NAD(P)-binding protein [Aureobasidium subglaciale]